MSRGAGLARDTAARELGHRSLFPVIWLSRIETCMKVREVLKMLKADGWYRVPARGGHRQFKHPKKRGRTTVSGKMNDTLAPGTLNSILKQAGLKS